METCGKEDVLGEFVEELKGGRREAASKIYEFTKPILDSYFGYAMYVWRYPADRTVVSDLVVETNTRFCTKAYMFEKRQDQPAIGLLYGFARNVWREYDRQQRRTLRCTQLPPQYADGPKDSKNEPHTSALRDACSVAVREAVGRLKDGNAGLYDVFYDFYFGDLSRAEIAEKRGLSIGTVKSRLHRAENFLRDSLEHLQGIGNPFTESRS